MVDDTTPGVGASRLLTHESFQFSTPLNKNKTLLARNHLIANDLDNRDEILNVTKYE